MFPRPQPPLAVIAAGLTGGEVELAAIAPKRPVAGVRSGGRDNALKTHGGPIAVLLNELIELLHLSGVVQSASTT